MPQSHGARRANIVLRTATGFARLPPGISKASPTARVKQTSSGRKACQMGAEDVAEVVRLPAGCEVGTFAQFRYSMNECRYWVTDPSSVSGPGDNCTCTMWRYSPLVESSSSCVPISAMRPSASTRMRSACTTVLRR